MRGGTFVPAIGRLFWELTIHGASPSGGAVCPLLLTVENSWRRSDVIWLSYGREPMNGPTNSRYALTVPESHHYKWSFSSIGPSMSGAEISGMTLMVHPRYDSFIFEQTLGLHSAACFFKSSIGTIGLTTTQVVMRSATTVDFTIIPNQLLSGFRKH